MAPGSLKFVVELVGEFPVNAPPAKPAVGTAPVECGCWPGRPGRPPDGGGPCRDKEKAFIFACISEDRPLALDGAGAGRLAALTALSGLGEVFSVGREDSEGGRRDGGFGEVASFEDGRESGEDGSESGVVTSSRLPCRVGSRGFRVSSAMAFDCYCVSVRAVLIKDTCSSVAPRLVGCWVFEG